MPKGARAAGKVAPLDSHTVRCVDLAVPMRGLTSSAGAGCEAAAVGGGGVGKADCGGVGKADCGRTGVSWSTEKNR